MLQLYQLCGPHKTRCIMAHEWKEQRTLKHSMTLLYRTDHLWCFVSVSISPCIPAKAAKPLCDILVLGIMIIKRCHDVIPGLPSECSREITQVIYWRKEKRSTLGISLYPSPSIHTHIFNKEELWACVHDKI